MGQKSLLISALILFLFFTFCEGDSSSATDQPSDHNHDSRNGKFFLGSIAPKADPTRSSGAKNKTTPGLLISNLFQYLGQSLGTAIDNFINVAPFATAHKDEQPSQVSSPVTMKWPNCGHPNQTFCYKSQTEELGCGIPNRAGRIVNGSTTEVNEYPWVAGIFIKHGKIEKLNCGGVLINSKYVLTAAHCVHSFSHRSLIVILGDHNKRTRLDDEEKLFKVGSILTHPAYDRNSFHADIALLGLQQRVAFTRAIRPVCLPVKDTDYDGQMATVIGWGRTRYRRSLNCQVLCPWHQIPIIPIQTCRKDSNYVAMEIKDNMICAGYFNGSKDACEGDSGGPLTVYSKTKQSVLIGLVSWGEGCGSPGYPGIYTRVSTFLTWIEMNTRDSCYCNGPVTEELDPESLTR